MSTSTMVQMSRPSERHLNDHKENVAKGTEVFVGGLPRSISEEKIKEVFSACGEIVEIRIIKDLKGNLKGFCFVRFATKEAASRAVKEKSGTLLDGKKIGVRPSSEQDTLYFGNLNKAWSVEEFERLVLQIFPDVASIDLVMLKNMPPDQKQRNRGFAFVKFSSHVAAARAYRVGSQPEFHLGNLHPAVQWAEEEPETDKNKLAKIKVAFVRNLPVDAEEKYLKQLFEPFGKVEKVVVSKKGSSTVGFVHFIERLDLERAIKELNDKTVQGPGGRATCKLQVEVARPLEKKKKRVLETSESNSPGQGQSKLLKESVALPSHHHSHVQRALESADPYEDAVIALPLAVKERLIRILRLGIATRFDIDIKILQSLKELPEAIAISILDQLMLSGADVQNKAAYLDGLISKGLNHSLISLSKPADTTWKESKLYSSSHQVFSGASFTSHAHSAAARPDIYSPNYPSLFPDYPLSSRTLIGRLDDRGSDFLLPNRSLSGSQSISFPRIGALEERNRSPLDVMPGSSMSYGRLGLRTEEWHLSPFPGAPRSFSSYDGFGASLGSDFTAVVGEQSSQRQIGAAPSSSTSYAGLGVSLSSDVTAVASQQLSRPQIRFDPFTGEPYKFDPFTGEPICPENPPRQF